MNDKHLVAVYGSLKRGFSNHRVLGDSKLLGSTKTEPVFTMYSMRSFPAIRKEGNTSIHIEVYEVDNDTLQRLYRLENYSGVRDAEENWYDTMDIETEWGKAEMFYFKNPVDLPIVESGNWQGRF